jgi:hypothetical protein
VATNQRFDAGTSVTRGTTRGTARDAPDAEHDRFGGITRRAAFSGWLS